MMAAVRRLGRAAGCALLCAGLAAPAPAPAHPHVFVDGGVDFVFGNDQTLEALSVTWRFDAFETLYTLSANEIRPNAEGTLSDTDRERLVEILSYWPEDFEGSAHLSVDGTAVAMARPTEFDVQLRDGRLEATFTRALEAPVETHGRVLEVGFYEAAYFYAFSVTQPPVLQRITGACRADVVHFEPNTQQKELQSVLLRLGREETPEIEDVGALFADRILVTCD